MKTIYIANIKEKKIITFFNKGAQILIVNLNDNEIDNVELSDSNYNFRVLEIELNSGDTISINENKNITYHIK
jgi:hypothetical protein